MKSETLPTVAITTGDPAGIGPEVVLKALADRELLSIARWVVIGDAAILNIVGKQIGLKTTGLYRPRHGQKSLHEWSCYKTVRQPAETAQVCLARWTPT